jgi:uncharacterized protein (TIGR03437 family)
MVCNLHRVGWLARVPICPPGPIVSVVWFILFKGKELPLILKNSSSARCCGLFFLAVAVLGATPRLQVAQTSFTVSVVPGSNGASQEADTFNLGDGQLNLTAASDSSWLVATLGKSGVCGLRGGCIPVQMALQTSSLAKGSYTGIVTLSDPKALDAPQYVTVTVAVGGNVPDNLEFFLAPGNSVSSTFTTGGTIKASVSNNTPWLTATTPTGGGGTLKITAGSSMAASDYNGTVTISGSKFAPDNKQIAVLLHVTTSPIVQTSSSAVQFQIAQGANKQTIPVAVNNSGQGTLTVSSVTAAAATGTWLSAATVTGGLTITADPSGLSPNTYPGTVTIASNAANSSVVIQVTLIVVAQIPPVAFAGGVVNNGTFGSQESVSQGDIVAVFGSQFISGDPQQAGSLPLATTLGDAQVLVNGKAAPVYYVSPGQINFEIPIDAATGDGTVQIVRGSQQGNQAYIHIASRVPRFILLNGGPYAIMTTPQGALTGYAGHSVKAGDVIVIYTIGLGPTSPSVPSGTASPSDTLAKVTVPVQVCFGNPTPFFQPPCAKPQFVGLTPNFVGLYQINVTIPSGIPPGNSPFLFTVDNVASDTVQLPVQ